MFVLIVHFISTIIRVIYLYKGKTPPGKERYMDMCFLYVLRIVVYTRLRRLFNTASTYFDFAPRPCLWAALCMTGLYPSALPLGCATSDKLSNVMVSAARRAKSNHVVG